MAAAVEQNLMQPAQIMDGELERLFREHHERVMRAAHRITGSMSDAEDVTQAVFLRVAQSGAWRAGIANPESYFFRAAINAALDALRKRVRENTIPLDDVLPERSAKGPESLCAAAELQSWLRYALAELDSRAAEMFALRYIEDCDLGEIARAFQTSRAVVAVTLHRTRARLRKKFQEKMRGER